MASAQADAPQLIMRTSFGEAALASARESQAHLEITLPVWFVERYVRIFAARG